MSRIDDVINVAGHRLSTGGMEEVLASHQDVAECAVIGVADQLKGELPLGLVVLKAGVDRPAAEIQKELVAKVRDEIGPVAAFKLVAVVKRLPKTRRQDPARDDEEDRGRGRAEGSRPRSTTRRSWTRCASSCATWATPGRPPEGFPALLAARLRYHRGRGRRRPSPRRSREANNDEHQQTAAALTVAAGTAAAGALPGGFAARGALAQGKKAQIATVVKIGGIPWFNAMEVGIKKAGEEQGVEAWMVGPTQADAAQQVRAVEDLIARKVDVIAVVPNDATALEPVFRRAQEAGIKVLTHESPDQKFNDWNIELTTVQGFGESHLEALANAMGGEGKYIVYVGSLTVPLHNKWADAAIALQKSKYPKMQMVTDRFGVAESLDDSYKTGLDQMRANPDLKGILAFGSQGPIGAARAVDERGKAGSVAVVGPFSPGQGARYIKAGSIREGFIWNPMLAGETIVRVANMIVKGQAIQDGMELPGLGPVKVDAAARSILAQKLQPINKSTIDELVQIGL
jgi:simple sugar transport system substrate-binding protein